MLDSYDFNLIYDLRELINICEKYKKDCYENKAYVKASTYQTYISSSKILIKLFGQKRYEHYCDFVKCKILFSVAFGKMIDDLKQLKDAFAYYYNYEFGQSIIEKVIALYIDLEEPKDLKYRTYQDYEDKLMKLTEQLRNDVKECIKQQKEKEEQEARERDRLFKQRYEEQRQEEAERAKQRYRSYYNDYFNRYNNFNRFGFNQEQPKKSNGIPYEVKKAFIELGIPSGSDVSVSIVKRAYKKMALKHHPDRGGSVDKMAEINSYYETAIKWLTRNK